MNQISEQEKVFWEYYQNLRCEFDSGWPRLNYIIKKIKKRAVGIPHVLNVGAGDGYMERSIVARGWVCYSLDLDEKTVKRLSDMKVNAYMGRIEQMPFNDNLFDFVVASEVLEHLTEEQRRKGLAEVSRVLKHGGWFLGSIPYNENLLEKEVICPKCGEIFHYWGHIQSFNIEKTKTILTKHFNVREIRVRHFFRWSKSNWKGKIYSLAKYLFGLMGVHGKNENIFFAARKD